MRDTTPQNDALRQALVAARKFIRGRHSTLTYGPQALLEQIDAALARQPAPEPPKATNEPICKRCNHPRSEHSEEPNYECMNADMCDCEGFSYVTPAAPEPTVTPVLQMQATQPPVIPVNAPTCAKCGEIFLDCKCALTQGESVDADQPTVTVGAPAPWTEREQEAIKELRELTGLSEIGVLRQGLRAYQLIAKNTHRLIEFESESMCTHERSEWTEIREEEERKARTPADLDRQNQAVRTAIASIAWHRGYDEGNLDGSPYPSQFEIDECVQAALQAGSDG
jgi:hypothetical protein